MSFILLPTVMEFAGALSAVVFSGIGGEGVDSGGGDHLFSFWIGCYCSGLLSCG